MTSLAQCVDILNLVISLTHKNTVKIRFRIYGPSTACISNFCIINAYRWPSCVPMGVSSCGRGLRL